MWPTLPHRSADRDTRHVCISVYGTINDAASHATHSAGVPMHLLRLFLAAWLVLGILAVFFLFWLCRRTAKRVNALGKPVLDRDAFQQLLAAAYILQEQNHFPAEGTTADSSRTVSVRLKSVPIANFDVDIPPSPDDSIVPSTHEGLIRSDKFFWKIATALATAACITLLWVTSLDRLSPLPAGLELVHQGAPFHERLPRSTVGTQMQPRVTAIENPVVAAKPERSTAAPAHKTTVRLTRHSVYESEADMVAPDTVMRYARRSSVDP